jgi:hypothetical protein
VNNTAKGVVVVPGMVPVLVVSIIADDDKFDPTVRQEFSSHLGVFLTQTPQSPCLGAREGGTAHFPMHVLVP